MAQISLRKILSKESSQVLNKLLLPIDEPIGILDQEGKLILGVNPDPTIMVGEKTAIMFEGQPVGWVTGMHDSPWKTGITNLLEYWVSKEAEKRALASEVLDKYRELSLLYRLAEKLVASPQPEAIAKMTLQEVCPLIQVSGGLVILKQTDGEQVSTLATCENPYHLKIYQQGPENLIQRVLASGIAEIGNNLDGDDYLFDAGGSRVSLLCAPLKTEKRILGAIVLIGGGTKVFTAGDLKLVSTIAMQTAPAIEIAHLYQMELEKAFIERDLQTAYQVQAGLLPHTMPILEGWRLSAYWKPAREVGGDFYEFIHLPDGRLGIAIADVSDKGVPAALVMANTHSVLRAITAGFGEDEHITPGMLLSRINNVLCDDTPMNMFITCLLVFLDLESGHVWYANAGHNLPYHRTADGVSELYATGVPLAIFPGVVYDEHETQLRPGESLLMYSDGLVEAHNISGDLFGTPRLYQVMSKQAGVDSLKGNDLIHHLLSRLGDFTGPNWEQEDDVTMVVLDRG